MLQSLLIRRVLTLAPYLAIVLLAAWVLILRSSLTTLTAKHAILKHDSQELAARYAGTSRALEQCALSAKAMRNVAEQQRLAGEQAAERLAKLSASLAQFQARIRAAEDADRALPACETLLRTDLAAVCPGRALGVRQRALSGAGS